MRNSNLLFRISSSQIFDNLRKVTKVHYVFDSDHSTIFSTYIILLIFQEFLKLWISILLIYVPGQSYLKVQLLILTISIILVLWNLDSNKLTLENLKSLEPQDCQSLTQLDFDFHQFQYLCLYLRLHHLIDSRYFQFSHQILQPILDLLNFEEVKPVIFGRVGLIHRITLLMSFANHYYFVKFLDP